MIKASQYFTLEYDGNSLGRLKSMNLKINGKEIQTSNFNTAVSNEYLKGRNDVTIDFTSIYDQGNAALDDVLDALLVYSDGTNISLKPLNSVSGDISYSCTGFPVNAGYDFNDDDKPEISATFRITSLIKSTDGSGFPYVFPYILS